MKKTLLTLAVCLAFAAQAAKPAAKPAVEDGPTVQQMVDAYKGRTDFYPGSCAEAYIRAWDSATAMDSGASCVADGEKFIMTFYNWASNAVNKSAREPLKTHLVKTLSALRGTMPTTTETRLSYRDRQGRAIVEMNEAWVRFQLEYKP